MAPLCFITYILIQWKSPYARDMQIITSVFQLIGTYFFIVPELLMGCSNLLPFYSQSCLPLPPLDLFHGFFFYLAVGLNVVWIVVPLYIIYSSVMENGQMVADAMKSTEAKKRN